MLFFNQNPVLEMLDCSVLERTRALQRLQATTAHAGRNNLYFTARGTEMCRSKVPLGPLMGRREEGDDDGPELHCTERGRESPRFAIISEK